MKPIHKLLFGMKMRTDKKFNSAMLLVLDECPEGWFGRYNRCFKSMDKRVTWTEAQAACENQDAFLMTFDFSTISRATGEQCSNKKYSCNFASQLLMGFSHC